MNLDNVELQRGLATADFFEREDIVARMQAVNELERKHHYTPTLSTASYWLRVQEALKSIPPEHHEGALALFGSVIYITDNLLAEALRMLSSEIVTRCKAMQIACPQDVHVFAVDHPGLVDRFYEAGGWGGRMDNIPQRLVRSTSDLLEKLEGLIGGDMDIEHVRAVFAKSLWVLLCDNALSGGSVLSDLQRLMALRDDIAPSTGANHIVLCTQILTGQAQSLLLGKCDNLYGILIDDRFRVNKEECALYEQAGTRAAVQSLCEWFGTKYLASIPSGDHLHKTVSLHREKEGNDSFAYGWLDGGYTIVMQKNAPTNSVPLFWYPAAGDKLAEQRVVYRPPFPRNHSRQFQTTSGDGSRLEKILQSSAILTAKLTK